MKELIIIIIYYLKLYLHTVFYGSREGTSDFRLQTSDFRLQTSDFRLQTSDFRLQTSDFRLRTSDFRLQTSDFRLQTSDFKHWFRASLIATLLLRSWLIFKALIQSKLFKLKLKMVRMF
jgi:hypothetical protein